MLTQYANLFEAIILNSDAKDFGSLLECITWPRTTDYLDFELLITALEFGRKDIANHLLDRKCRISNPESDEVHPLHLALMACDDFSGVVKRLLALGASVSATNAQGNNAVHVAFVHNAPGRIIDTLLLSYLSETNKNAKNADGLSVLHVVCSRPNLLIMRKFVEKMGHEKFVKNELDCQVDLRCDGTYAGYTPLHFAVSYGSKEIAKFLVMNFIPNAFVRDANNSTPLHLALERRFVHAIDLIVAYNFPEIAHKDVVNNTGLSHFMAACAAKIQDSAVKFMEVAKARSYESLDTLVNRRVNITNDQPYAGYSPIHFAAELGRANTVQQLVHFGASFFRETAGNYSPLVLALKHGHDEIARFVFWCYKQYRYRELFPSDTDDSNASCSAKTFESDYWFTCDMNFHAADA